VGVAGNCNVDQQSWPGGRRRVDIAPGTTAISLAIACEAIPDDRLPPGGQLAFVRDGRIYRVNSDGSGLVRLTDGPSDAQPSWSPDGRRIAFTRRLGTTLRSDLYIMDSDGSNTVRRLAGGAFLGAGTTWSPDGKHIAFDCFPNTGSVEICVISADGDGTGATAIERTGYDGQPAWSPDGSRIAFVSDWAFYDFALDIFVMTLDSGSVTQLTDGQGDVGFFDPAWSPDGRKLAVVSRGPAYDAGGPTKLLLLNGDGSGGTTLTTTRVASGPAWSPDGHTIAFGTLLGIEWISADGSQRGLIVAEGSSPSWRP
jgi:Tol biopolymer transport system component